MTIATTLRHYFHPSLGLSAVAIALAMTPGAPAQADVNVGNLINQVIDSRTDHPAAHAEPHEKPGHEIKSDALGVLHVECWKQGKLHLAMDRTKGTKNWTEHNINGAVDKRWVTDHRDEHSFYLTKPDVRLQLDLWEKKCYWNGEAQPSMNIREAE